MSGAMNIIKPSHDLPKVGKHTTEIVVLRIYEAPEVRAKSTTLEWLDAMGFVVLSRDEEGAWVSVAPYLSVREQIARSLDLIIRLRDRKANVHGYLYAIKAPIEGPNSSVLLTRVKIGDSMVRSTYVAKLAACLASDFLIHPELMEYFPSEVMFKVMTEDGLSRIETVVESQGDSQSEYNAASDEKTLSEFEAAA